jgi:hypothetical protein
MGPIESGKSVQLRFPVPNLNRPVVGYWLGMEHQIVGFSGNGSSYQLVIRKDSADGLVVYEGPVISNGYDWNVSNVQMLDLTDKLTETDHQRGYLDVWVQAIVAGDGWTIYRHNPARPFSAYSTIESADTRQQAELMRRGISIIPVPKNILLREGDFVLSAHTRIVYCVDAPASVGFAARELQALLKERVGLALQVTRVKTPDRGDIALGVRGKTAWPKVVGVSAVLDHREGCYVVVTPEGAQVLGADEAGCFYGAMTLGHMARSNGRGAILAACSIEDWPAFPNRIVQYDIARGQSVNVQYVKRMIRTMARFKMNGLLFYMEDDFKFHKYPFLGRPGTFTHKKARALTEFARPYHIQLIPQFESLGHASSVLEHTELKNLREAGGSRVFCTSEPATWEFLDNVFSELVDAFPTTDFIHVGGDEFESGFAQCGRCKARVAEVGLGGLYAEHMNRLNELVKKRGKTMMFWPSHAGPTPELSFMTIKYHDKLQKDSIPTEWIYHGPDSYPEIEVYQKLGFKDVYCSPSVWSPGAIYPDNKTIFRGIRGFFMAGEDRHSGGALCTTWEFIRGVLVENSWYGLIFAAECSWSPASTSMGEFDRRFADIWWGISGAGVPVFIADTISSPFSPVGLAGMWRDGQLAMKLLWSDPTQVMSDFGNQSVVSQKVDSLVSSMAAALTRIGDFRGRARRNGLTFRAANLSFALMHYAGRKLAVYKEISYLYMQACKSAMAGETKTAAEKLTVVVGMIGNLQAAAEKLAVGYAYFVENCGAYEDDVKRLQAQSKVLASIVVRLTNIRVQIKAGVDLPPGSEFGFL